MNEYLSEPVVSDKFNFLEITLDDLDKELLEKLSLEKNFILILSTDNPNTMAELRRAFIELINNNVELPVIIKRDFSNNNDLTDDELLVHTSTDIGGLLLDGLGDGVWIESSVTEIKKINNISFGILQATRTRITRTDYISCPSCGRTLFDLQETTAKIRKRTDHLKGLKIAIMGCIVNGPGEMADADYGYVGSGPGKITLYKGREVVKKSIDTEIAVDELITLIKENNDWTEVSN